MTGNNGTKVGIMAFLAGSAAGLAAGILVAPKSGQQTRADIQRRAKDTASRQKNNVTDKLTGAADMTKSIARESKQAAKDAKERLQEDQTVG